MINWQEVKNNYESMRATAISNARTNETRFTNGTTVLLRRGLLGWAMGCFSPASRLLELSHSRPKLASDPGSELRNILTSMALRFVEGA
jgi:hypothetical protein